MKHFLLKSFNTCAREVRKHRQARARDARAKTGARARCASKAREHCARAHFGHARANKLSKSGFGELICDLESLFARAESLFARARVSDGRAHLGLACAPRARGSICSRVSRARLSLLAHLARARVKCSRARAAHPAAGEAPYMNSYVLNQAK